MSNYENGLNFDGNIGGEVRASPHSGYLKVVLGCMFSGKTSEIIKEYNKLRSIDINVLCINYVLDERYSNENYLHSHDKHQISCIKVKNLSEVQNIQQYDEIMINEGQFFSDLKQYVLHWTDDLNKNVIVVGLDGDYKRVFNFYFSYNYVIPIIPINPNFISS